MDPMTAAVCDMLGVCVGDLRTTVAGVDTDSLNRAPAPGANSIAVLVTHAVTATRWLVDAALTGRMDRERYRREDRTPAFATKDADAARLLALIDDLEATAARLAAEGGKVDYAGAVEFEHAYEDGPRTRAWSLIHALEHLREHVGHAQLTRQVIEQA